MPDSSSTAGTVNDGAAMVVTEGDPANHTALFKKRQCEATFTSSCDEENAVMRMALGWLLPSHAAVNRFLKRSRAVPPTLQTCGAC